jgi:serine/threonine protein kinase
VERLTDKTHFAAKAFAKATTINSPNPANKSVLLNEIDMLRTFDNPNIMKLEGVFESENSLYIILELLPDGQVHTRINQRMAKFTEEEVKTFMRGMVRALYDM